MNVQRPPGANVIATVDAIKAKLPELQAGLPAALKIEVSSDRTAGIRTSVEHVQLELVLAVVLVVLVIFAFLGSPRATVIASIAVPISLIGTFGLMALLGYSLNNLSLMALTTIATGFVVDDAIVMIENIARHLEMAGHVPAQGHIGEAGVSRSQNMNGEMAGNIPAQAHTGGAAGRAVGAASRVGDLFNASSTLWSLGLSVAQTVFDASRVPRRRETAPSHATGRPC